jgi:hypothetical protein
MRAITKAKIVPFMTLAVLLIAAGSLNAQRISVGIGFGGYYAPRPPVYVYSAPPPPVYSYMPVSPGSNYVWVPGYYYPAGPRYAWRAGYWAPRPWAGAVWVGPRYARGYYYHGYWRR